MFSLLCSLQMESDFSALRQFHEVVRSQDRPLTRLKPFVFGPLTLRASTLREKQRPLPEHTVQYSIPTLLSSTWRVATSAHTHHSCCSAACDGRRTNTPNKVRCTTQQRSRVTFQNVQITCISCQTWSCTVTTVCNYWWHVSHVNCGAHASGALHRLCCTKVCVFNSEPALCVDVRACEQLGRLASPCCLLPCLLCYALHDIAVMICTLMSIY